MKRIKYPRTFHIPQSPGATSDDKILSSLDHFIGKEIVITEKRDGENTTIYSDGYMHARSIDGNNHISRNWIKGNIVPLIQYQIPESIRICGENLYAQHSIPYNNLKSYFEVFSIWTNDQCSSWDDTEIFCESIGLITVPILYKGLFSEKVILDIIKSIDFSKQEGFVIRNKESFHLKDFSTNIAKFVRKGHVNTEQHWMHQKIIPNKLISLFTKV
jgi:hypothetical protein